MRSSGFRVIKAPEVGKMVSILVKYDAVIPFIRGKRADGRFSDDIDRTSPFKVRSRSWRESPDRIPNVAGLPDDADEPRCWWRDAAGGGPRIFLHDVVVQVQRRSGSVPRGFDINCQGWTHAVLANPRVKLPNRLSLSAVVNLDDI